ncbi:MAG: serine/threonine protein kinase [Desulfurococcales archaeon]|nr:serine/threonine protein kinase [Desulfurococcales archaeon]
MTSTLAKLYNNLTRDSIRVLQTIESLLQKYEYPPLELVEKKSKLPPGRFRKALSLLNELGLLRRSKHQLMGYTLTFQALDILALHTFVMRGTISELGPKLGVGKESEVYDAVTSAGKRVVVKFHREGARAFRTLKRHRSFATDMPRKKWLQKAKLIGQREYKALDELYRLGARVPMPIDYNRHAVVQEYVEGVELHVIDRDGLPNPLETLEMILDTLAIAYQKAGIVHGDLSEYNIVVTIEDGTPYIIDWPQYVYKDDPTAPDLLRRDVWYIIRFFKKRFRVEIPLDQALRRVTGE